MMSSSSPPFAVTGSRKRKASVETHPIYQAIVPVRPLFHCFLTDDDAARLLRVARSFIAPVLSSFTFHQHFFESLTLASLHRLKTVYEANGLHVTQMGIPKDVKQLQLDPTTGASPLPSSLLSLVLTQPMHGLFNSSAVEAAWAAFSAVAADWQTRPPYCLPDPDIGVERYRRLTTGEPYDRWRATFFSDPIGELDCPIAPGLLPRGLRVLQLGHAYNTAFLPGSLPDTLTFLQTGRQFNAPIAAGTLPPSLLYLSLNYGWNHPLEVGVLPASLQYLAMSQVWTHPLHVSVLPASLLALTLSSEWNHPLLPGVLPPSLLHLSFGTYFNQPLAPGVLPSSLTSLYLGCSFDHPLTAGVLPPSLRELWLSALFCQPIARGQLNEGLQYLCFATEDSGTYPLQLQAGVLPSSMVALDLTDRYRQVLKEGVVHAGVKWMRLHRCYEKRVAAALPATTELRWWGSD